jgi:hypothetical protein
VRERDEPFLLDGRARGRASERCAYVRVCECLYVDIPPGW